MVTVAKFKIALKELMKSTSIDDISVTVLCKKCNCHRQTFYYHYTDIYDLISDILLNDKIEGLDKSNDIKEVLQLFTKYLMENFDFYKTTYSSSARDLPDEFIFGKLRAKFLEIITSDKTKFGFKRIAGARDAARCFAKICADEFGDRLKENAMNTKKFETKMEDFIEKSTKILLPAVVEMFKD